MYSAYYQWNKNAGRLEIITVGANGKGVMPSPIRPFCKVVNSVVNDVRAYAISSNQPDITVRSSDFKDLKREPVSIVEATKPAQIGNMRDALRALGIGHKQILEADVTFIRNWMMEKELRCAPHYPKLYWDIEVWDKEGQPNPKNPIYPIISIGAVSERGETYCFTAEHRTLEEARANEASIIKPFTELAVGKLCAGWYSGISREAKEAWFDTPYFLGRVGINKIQFNPAMCRWADVVIPFVYTREHKWKSTSLDFVSQKILGKRKKAKPVSGHIADFTLEELRAYNVGDEDQPGDAYLTKLIDENAMGKGESLTDLLTEIAYETHLFPDDVLFTPDIHTIGPKPSRVIDSLFLKEARRLKWALPSKPSEPERLALEATLPKDAPRYKGAIIVRDPTPGVHHNVLWLDVESIYPFAIVYTRVSPDPDGEIAPNLMLRYLEKKRKAENKVRREVYKIILNATYGSFGSTYTRMFDVAKAAVIPALGRDVITMAASVVEREGWVVIYGDTDSLALELPYDPQELGMSMEEVGKKFTAMIEEELRKKYGNLAWEINMPFDHFSAETYFLKVAGLTRGAKKRRYEHIVYDKKGACDKYEAKGIEQIRSDQCAILERTQEALLRAQLVGEGEAAKGVLETVGKDIYANKYPIEDFVVSKGFGKKMGDYSKRGEPAHVRVRKVLESRGLWTGDSKAHFVWTKRGAVPYLEGEHIDNVDYDKYWGLIVRMAQRADVNTKGIKVKPDVDATVDDYLFSS